MIELSVLYFILIVLYFIYGILWTMATRDSWHTENIKWPKLVAIILINILLWPIALMALSVAGPYK